MTLIKRSGYRLNIIDATIVIQKPQLSDFIPHVIENLSQTMNLNKTAISVKATTTDGLGVIGNGLGWSVLALATLTQ